MLSTFQATLSPMLVMFLCIVTGFVLNKKKLCPANTATVLSKLENNVLIPALVINTFMKYCTVASLREQYKLVLYCVIAVLIAIALAYPLSRLFEKDGYKKNIYRYAMAFGNFGFMGNAIVPAILGSEALYNYMLFTLPLNIAVYTWGASILIPKEYKDSSANGKKPNPLLRLLNPAMVSIALGAALGLTGAEAIIPSFITTTLGNLAACMGPLAMVLTGFVIGDYDVLALIKNKKVYAASFLRLFILPAFFLALLMLLGADDQTVTYALFAYATPLGLNTVVFPAAYGGDTSTGASMAMISHTVCVVTIPLMYALLLMIL